MPDEYNDPELEMFKIISALKVPFLSHEPIHTPDKDYEADFLIMRGIVVEVDGAVHGKGKQPMKDEHRDEAMKQLGLRILRFRTEEVNEHPSECAEKIRAEIERLPIEIRTAAFAPAGKR